ncbi:hypothetical protein [Kiloniella antarctica]|uniref:EF-hand domain-containing protein n=1 Tax=Kiloniella antarctica TaxID=1550907 RepID=A0ABW5BRI4_9PROT
MTKPLKRLSLFISFASITFSAYTSPAFADVINPYPEQLQEVLGKYNIDSDNILSQTTLEKAVHDRNNERLLGYNTYIRFKDCKGYLRVFQHRFGRVDNVFTRGECKIPGIENF